MSRFFTLIIALLVLAGLAAAQLDGTAAFDNLLTTFVQTEPGTLTDLQAALDKVGGLGGTVHLSGDYLINGTATPRSNTIVDCAPGASITQTARYTRLFYLHNVDTVTIRGCKLRGQSDWDEGRTSGNFARLIDIEGSNNIHIEDNDIGQFGFAGITIRNSTRIWIEDNTITGLDLQPTDNYNMGIEGMGFGANYGPVYIRGNNISQGAQGINSQEDAEGWFITSNYIHDIKGQHAVYIVPGKGFVIDNNYIWNTALNGIKVQKVHTSTVDTIGGSISNNWLYHINASGVDLNIASGDANTRTFYNVKIANNVMDYVDYGIATATSVPALYHHDLYIANNTITRATNYGIRPYAFSGTVANNTVTHVGGTALYFDAGAGHDVVVANNTVRDSGNGAIYAGRSGLVAVRDGLHSSHGNITYINNIIANMHPGAFRTAEFADTNLRVGGINYWDPSKPFTTSGLTFTDGLGPFNLSTAQRDSITNPQAGLQVFNATTKLPNFYDGTAWKQVPAAGMSQVITVRKGDDSGPCTITVLNGAVIETTCP